MRARLRSGIATPAAALVLLALAAGITACGSDDDDDSGAGGREERIELTIGNSVPLSGALREFGPEARRAASIAVDELNAALEDAGARHSVELLTVDNETDPERATTTAQELVDDGASCIVGPWNAPDTLSVARSVAIPEDVALISPATTIDEMSTLEDDGLVNRTAPPDTAQGIVLADAIADDVGDTEDAIVNVGARSDAYGQTLARSFARAWEAKGGEVAAETFYDPSEEPGAAVAKQIAAGDPVAIVILDFADSFARLAPALARTSGYDPEIAWGTDLLATTALAEEAPQGAIEGLRGTLPGLAEGEPQAEEFEKLLAESSPEGSREAEGDDNVEPPPYAARTFDATILCFLAALAAGSDAGERLAGSLAPVSGPKGEKVTWQDLPRAIRLLEKGEEIDYEGVSGAIDLDSRGDPTAGIYDIYRFDGGDLVLTDEFPLNVPAARTADSR